MGRIPLIREAAIVLSLLALDATPALAADDPPSRTTPIVVRVDDRFSWSDAGIGVVAGAGAALAVVGGAAILRSSETERPRHEGREHSHDH
jgi:hypothetical protein